MYETRKFENINGRVTEIRSDIILMITEIKGGLLIKTSIDKKLIQVIREIK